MLSKLFSKKNLSKDKSDKLFFWSVLALAVGGLFIFSSASLGILARDEEMFVSIALNQLGFGFCLGIIAFFVTSQIPYKFWKRISLPLFVLGLILTAAVFIPGLGLSHGGAKRWIDIGITSFQPSEFLKVGYVMYLAALLSRKRSSPAGGSKTGLLWFMILTGAVGSLLLMQPDNDTFLIIASAGFAMYFVSGASWKQIAIIGVIGIVGIAGVFITRPYIRDRVMTYLDPSRNPLSSGYQIQQSLIAIGSGGILGKGFGQSTQKFNFLPEPIGDSIFAVAGEEFGFLGSTVIVALFLAFSLRALKIASVAKDEFGRLLSVGIVILIIAGAFVNIAAMLGIIPLSGTPLPFISHGGTALLGALALAGIILNISKTVNIK